jgi:hypothetical protein
MSLLLFHQKNGSAGIMVIMILFAIASLVIGGITVIGVDDLETGYASWKSSESMRVAESCAEEALLRIKRNASYTGGTLQIGNTTCTMTVVGTPCGTCTVSISAQSGVSTKHLQTTLTKSGSLVTLTGWQEIE